MEINLVVILAKPHISLSVCTLTPPLPLVLEKKSGLILRGAVGYLPCCGIRYDDANPMTLSNEDVL